MVTNITRFSQPHLDASQWEVFLCTAVIGSKLAQPLNSMTQISIYASCESAILRAVCPFFWRQRSTYSQPAEMMFCVPKVFMCVCPKCSANPLHIILYHNYPKKKHSPPLIVIRRHSRIHMSPPTIPLPPLCHCLAGATIHYNHWLNGSTAWQSNSLAQPHN